MQSNRSFISEAAVATRRRGISHLHDMKDDEFITWLKSIKTISNGVLKDHKVVMKVDGLGARFGKDSSGKIFFEGSRTGPIYDSGAFSQFARERGSNNVDELVQRAIHYDNMLEVFKRSKIAKSLPTDSKVVCEVFYNPLSQQKDNGVVFVTVKYDRAKLGTMMTVLPYTVLVASTGEEHSDKELIKKSLLANSTDEIKVIDPNLKLTSIDISAFIKPIESITNMDVLQSRKKVDKEEKATLLALIQRVKLELTQYLLEHPGIEGKFKLGPDIEGIVLHINNNPYKLITTSFKEAHK